jgi:hypothetical protein
MGIPSLSYSLITPVIVIVMVALAEELSVISLLELLVSAIEMTLSLRTNKTGPAIIAGMTGGFFESTTSKVNYTRRYRVNTNF